MLAVAFVFRDTRGFVLVYLNPTPPLHHHPPLIRVSFHCRRTSMQMRLSSWGGCCRHNGKQEQKRSLRQRNFFAAAVSPRAVAYGRYGNPRWLVAKGLCCTYKQKKNHANLLDCHFIERDTNPGGLRRGKVAVVQPTGAP